MRPLITMKYAAIIIVLPFLFVLSLSPDVNALSAQQIVLDGVHKISPGDDPAWALPEYNDSRWQSVIVPGSWQSQGFRPVKGKGWYRIHFTAPASLKEQPAILLGRIGDVDEVFFNGIRIGGEGIIGERYVEATKIERLFSVPAELIRYNADNVISVRVMNTYLNGGIFDKGSAFGDYYVLMLEKLKREKNIIVIEYCLFTFFAMFFIGCLFFYMKGLRDREYYFFWLFISLYGLLFILGSVTFYKTGLKGILVQQIINAISALLPASLLILLKNVFQERLTFLIKSILAAYALIAVIIFVFPDYGVKQNMYMIWKMCFTITAIILLLFALKAFRRRFYESGPTLLGIAGLIVGFVLESIGGLDFLQITGFFLWDYSTAFFMICVMYALTARFTRIKELQTTSVRIFKAHEDERKRLARELHDGIGPSLLAIKLQFQMLETKVKEGAAIEQKAFPELIEEITHSIDELRAVAMDLRPSFLETTDINDAIAWHAGKMQERFGIRMNINIEGSLKMSTKVKEAVYRIYQESISNIIKHAEATIVDVTLKRDGRFLSLEIRDNGRGFDTAREKGRGAGIGLDTIRERVELLEGIINIKSIRNMGTTIYIEVPAE